MTLEEEDMEAMEDMKVKEAIEAEEGDAERLADDKDRLSVITAEQQGHFTWDCLTITCNYCKAPNHAIEECLVLLANIQEK